MKKIYTAAWFLLAILFLAAILTGYLNPVSLVAFSLFALGLVYALALWTVVINTREAAH